MANNCMTTLSIQSESEIGEEKSKAIAADIAENIEYTGGQVSYEDDTLIEWDGDTSWALPVDDLAALAKKHGVKIRAVGREDGCGFVEVACINAKGQVVQHESIDFAF